jgi:hypothetical protein
MLHRQTQPQVRRHRQDGNHLSQPEPSPVTPPTHDNQARQALTIITLTKRPRTMAPRVSLGLEDGAEFAEVRAVGVPDGGGQQEAASRGIRLALLLDGAISLAGSPC